MLIITVYRKVQHPNVRPCSSTALTVCIRSYRTRSDGDLYSTKYRFLSLGVTQAKWKHWRRRSHSGSLLHESWARYPSYTPRHTYRRVSHSPPPSVLGLSADKYIAWNSLANSLKHQRTSRSPVFSTKLLSVWHPTIKECVMRPPRHYHTLLTIPHLFVG